MVRQAKFQGRLGRAPFALCTVAKVPPTGHKARLSAQLAGVEEVASELIAYKQLKRYDDKVLLLSLIVQDIAACLQRQTSAFT